MWEKKNPKKDLINHLHKKNYFQFFSLFQQFENPSRERAHETALKNTSEVTESSYKTNTANENKKLAADFPLPNVSSVFTVWWKLKMQWESRLRIICDFQVITDSIIMRMLTKTLEILSQYNFTISFTK